MKGSTRGLATAALILLIYGFFQYACVGGNPGFTGTQIIVADPKFRDAATGNYRLRASSPAVNTGLHEAWMDGAVDVDGAPRIQHGAVDMGAYEILLIRGSMFTVW